MSGKTDPRRDDEDDQGLDRATRRIEGGAAAVLAGLIGMTAVVLLACHQPAGAAFLTLTAVIFAFFAVALLGAGEAEDD